MKSDFEAMAYDLLEYCYENNKEKAKEILLVEAEEFDNLNCFEFVKTNFEIDKNEEENSKKFIAHECFQTVVSNIWYGESSYLKTWEYLAYLFICILFSPILLLFHIQFSVSRPKTLTQTDL